MREIVFVNGHHLHLEVFGINQENPIIFLHHGLGSTKSWKFQISDFVASGFKVILYDRWGYGESDARTHFSMPEFREDIEDLLGIMDKLKYQQVNLIGHSDGGTISLIFSARYPSFVSKQIVVAAHIYVEEKMIHGIEKIRQEYESKTAFRYGLSKYHGEKSNTVFRGWYDGWMREENLYWEISEQLKNVICPTLIIQGSEDEHAEPQHAQEIHNRISHSELVLLEKSAHMVLQDNPERINPIMINFLRGIN
jgi:pimeloyl-ACP methyl ester carboxylesterase